MKVLAVMSQQYAALHAAHLRIWERRELCMPGKVYRFGGTEGSQMITDLTYLLAWRPLSDEEVDVLHKAAVAPPGFGPGGKLGFGLGGGGGGAEGKGGMAGGKLAAAVATAAPTVGAAGGAAEGDPLDKAEAVVGVLAAARRMGGGSVGALTPADERLLRQSRNQCLQAMVESVLLDDLEHLVRACDVYSRLNPDDHAGIHGGAGAGGRTGGHHAARSPSRGQGHAAWGAGGHTSLATSRDMGPPSAPPSAHPSRVGGRGVARGPEAEAAAIVEAAAAAAAVKGHVFWMRGVGGNSLSDIVSKMSPLEPRPSFLTVAGLPLTAVAAERNCQPRLLLHLVAAGAEVNVYALRYILMNYRAMPGYGYHSVKHFCLSYIYHNRNPLSSTLSISRVLDDLARHNSAKAKEWRLLARRLRTLGLWLVEALVKLELEQIAAMEAEGGMEAAAPAVPAAGVAGGAGNGAAAGPGLGHGVAAGETLGGLGDAHGGLDAMQGGGATTLGQTGGAERAGGAGRVGVGAGGATHVNGQLLPTVADVLTPRGAVITINDESPLQLAYETTDLDFMSTGIVQSFLQEKWLGADYIANALQDRGTSIHTGDHHLILRVLESAGFVGALGSVFIKYISWLNHIVIVAGRPFFDSPRGRWVFRLLCEVFFLYIFHTVQLSGDHEALMWQHLVLVAYVASQVADEMLEAVYRYHGNLRVYFNSGFNLIEVACIVLLVASGVCKVVMWSLPGGTYNPAYADVATAKDFLYNSTSIFVWCRLLQYIVPLYEGVGAYLYILTKMTKEVLKFAVPGVIIMTGVAFTLVATFRDRDVEKLNSFTEVMLLLFRTFLGETMFEVLEGETNMLYNLYANVLVLLYTVSATVVLANLLIALISFHFQPTKVEAQSKFHMAQILAHYEFMVEHQLLGAPFSVTQLLAAYLLPSGWRPMAPTDTAHRYGIMPMDGRYESRTRRMFPTGSREIPYLIYLLTLYPLMMLTCWALWILAAPYCITYFGLYGYRRWTTMRDGAGAHLTSLRHEHEELTRYGPSMALTSGGPSKGAGSRRITAAAAAAAVGSKKQQQAVVAAAPRGAIPPSPGGGARASSVSFGRMLLQQVSRLRPGGSDAAVSPTGHDVPPTPSAATGAAATLPAAPGKVAPAQEEQKDAVAAAAATTREPPAHPPRAITMMRRRVRVAPEPSEVIHIERSASSVTGAGKGVGGASSMGLASGVAGVGDVDDDDQYKMIEQLEDLGDPRKLAMEAIQQRAARRSSEGSGADGPDGPDLLHRISANGGVGAADLVPGGPVQRSGHSQRTVTGGGGGGESQYEEWDNLQMATEVVGLAYRALVFCVTMPFWLLAGGAVYLLLLLGLVAGLWLGLAQWGAKLGFTVYQVLAGWLQGWLGIKPRYAADPSSHDDPGGHASGSHHASSPPGPPGSRPGSAAPHARHSSTGRRADTSSHHGGAATAGGGGGYRPQPDSRHLWVRDYQAGLAYNGQVLTVADVTRALLKAEFSAKDAALAQAGPVHERGKSGAAAAANVNAAAAAAAAASAAKAAAWVAGGGGSLTNPAAYTGHYGGVGGVGAGGGGDARGPASVADTESVYALDLNARLPSRVGSRVGFRMGSGSNVSGLPHQPGAHVSSLLHQNQQHAQHASQILLHAEGGCGGSGRGSRANIGGGEESEGDEHEQAGAEGRSELEFGNEEGSVDDEVQQRHHDPDHHVGASGTSDGAAHGNLNGYVHSHAYVHGVPGSYPGSTGGVGPVTAPPSRRHDAQTPAALREQVVQGRGGDGDVGRGGGGSMRSRAAIAIDVESGTEQDAGSLGFSGDGGGSGGLGASGTGQGEKRSSGEELTLGGRAQAVAAGGGRGLAAGLGSDLGSGRMFEELSGLLLGSNVSLPEVAALTSDRSSSMLPNAASGGD
ncbi:hypothetical protein HYH02_005744 [Chlamydomonas schloesseri]|uniref:Ion transport domain-containing protein n=1 Tax=Chlamydomonas schloesseri TaxID=2026947 RepID=A0A835WK95_9CHLO|nr:hypothetical protein HYH02_005744 [Chlamydomonas schloesseri]|eukprot:KAG2448990.1 hypothetical protein HYH02_005744 [Chlamydomonas schloesseri]